MQTNLDVYLVEFKTQRPHQGRGMDGRTRITAFKAGIPKRKKTTGATTEKAA